MRPVRLVFPTTLVAGSAAMGLALGGLIDVQRDLSAATAPVAEPARTQSQDVRWEDQRRHHHRWKVEL